jgi:3-oxoacyl-[acyl-carrier-protein] synthase II
MWLRTGQNRTMGDRIAITGAGIISAIGAGKEETLRSLLACRSGIGPLHHLRTSHVLPCGEVSMSDDELKSILGIPSDKQIARTSLLGIYAVREALSQASSKEQKIALVSGTTVGDMDVTERIFLNVLRGDEFNEYLKLHTCGSSTRDIADYFGIFDSLTTTSTACSSAANSLILAARLIRSGRADVVVAGGAECLTKYHLNGFNSLMILDSEPCRPFDASRAGLNLGEGAGFLVLESQAHAQARGAEPLAFLDGYGNACDAFHQTASSPDGDGAYKAMNEAIAMAGLEPRDIDYVNAHGTGTVNNDESESRALKRTFGEGMPPVSSTKSFTGHTTSASGGIESVICLLAMLNGFIPVNLGWKTPFEGGIIPYVDTPTNPDSGCASSARKVRLEHVLCNSFAFGGNDTSLLFSRI